MAHYKSKIRNLYFRSDNLTIHTFDFLVENWHLSKGSDVSDCSLSSQKTFASESCVTCLQRFVETETAACPFLAQLPHQTFVQMGRIVAWVFVDSGNIKKGNDILQ